MVTKVKYIINVNFKIKIAKIICFKSLTSKTHKFCTPHTNYQLFSLKCTNTFLVLVVNLIMRIFCQLL